MDGSELGSCCDLLRVELRLQLSCFLEVAADGALGRVLSRLGRCPSQLRGGHERLAHVALGRLEHCVGL